MPRYKVLVPVEINWQVYKRNDIVTVPDESVVWGVRLPDLPVEQPAAVKPPDTLSALARQQHAAEVAALARIGAGSAGDPTGMPTGIQPRPSPQPPPAAPAPDTPAVEPPAAPDPLS